MIFFASFRVYTHSQNKFFRFQTFCSRLWIQIYFESAFWFLVLIKTAWIQVIHFSKSKNNFCATIRAFSSELLSCQLFVFLKHLYIHLLTLTKTKGSDTKKTKNDNISNYKTKSPMPHLEIWKFSDRGSISGQARGNFWPQGCHIVISSQQFAARYLL